MKRTSLNSNMVTVELPKKKLNYMTGEYEHVVLAVRREEWEYKLARDLVVLLRKHGMINLDDAATKLRINKIQKVKGSDVTVESIVHAHPLDFKLMGNVILNAR